jgi:hypothetical protein
VDSAREGLDLGPVTPFTDFLANLGSRNDPGLLLFCVDDQMVIPSKLLQQTGMLYSLVSTINMLYLSGTCEQKFRWWTTKSMHLNGRAPIDCLGDDSLQRILIGMANTHHPFDPTRI